MNPRALMDKYQARVASFYDGDAAWVRAKANYVDVSHPESVKLVGDLEHIMDACIQEHGWVAASSNNVYWNATEGPISVMRAPYPGGRKFLTFVNPKITLTSDEPVILYEACASLRKNDIYMVSRSPSVKVEGWVLDKKGWASGEKIFREARMSYGPSVAKGRMADAGIKASVLVQHEYDHLQGVLLLDRSNVTEMFLPQKEMRADLSTDEAILLMSAIYEAQKPLIDSCLIRGEEKGLGNGWAYEVPEDKVPADLGKRHEAARRMLLDNRARK
ncbi:TPA: hypothetical protein HA295_05980 [Candidatus Woesearchaeota archaeon]|nr:hypothetical protein [Candidatus Woesearchaeota archaeon]